MAKKTLRKVVPSGKTGRGNFVLWVIVLLFLAAWLISMGIIG